MNGKRNNPAQKIAGGVPARGDGYTMDDVKTALEESQKALHEAVFIARRVWEQDSEALRFDIDDLVQIESALEEICNLSAGIAVEDDEE